MDFLKSAVVSAIQKSSAFPYIVGDRVDFEQSLWTLNNGTKRVRNYLSCPGIEVLMGRSGRWFEM